MAVISYRRQLIIDYLTERVEDGKEFSVNDIHDYLEEHNAPYTNAQRPQIGVWMTLKNKDFIDHLQLKHKIIVRRVGQGLSNRGGAYHITMRAENYHFVEDTEMVQAWM